MEWINIIAMIAGFIAGMIEARIRHLIELRKQKKTDEKFHKKMKQIIEDSYPDMSFMAVEELKKLSRKHINFNDQEEKKKIFGAMIELERRNRNV